MEQLYLDKIEQDKLLEFEKDSFFDGAIYNGKQEVLTIQPSNISMLE